MKCPIYSKRAIRHNILREQALSTPNDTKTSVILTGDQVNKEELLEVIELLKEEKCEVKRLEIIDGKIDKGLAALLTEGISLDREIKELSIKGCIITFNAFQSIMKALRGNTNMQSLHIESVTIHEKEASLIAEMIKVNQGLCGITLLSCGVDDGAMIKIASALKENKQITHLDLRSNAIQEKGLHSLVQVVKETGSCQSLILEGIETEGDEVFAALQNLIEEGSSNITELGLSAVGIDENTDCKLINAIENIKNLQACSFSRNVCSLQFISTMAKKVNASKTLTSLNLSQCSITDEILSGLVLNLGTSNLNELDISRNSITSVSCNELKVFLERNHKIEGLYLHNNALGGKDFTTLAKAIGEHRTLKYLDISYTKLSNDGFVELFGPISKDKTKTEYLQCKGNNIGGKLLDNVLACVSRTLKVLDLSDNSLSEMNGEILKSYARNNVWIEAIHVDDNGLVKSKIIQSIKDQCFRNIQIKNFILQKLPRAEETGFKHKSLCQNCYSEFDVSEVTLEGLSFYKLDFLAKFMVQNKESMEKLILKDLQLENGGAYLTETFKGVASDIRLRTIFFKNVNFNISGLKKLITACGKMQDLTEFSLINIETVKNQVILQTLYETFRRHRSLEKLDLSGNSLPNYDAIIQILENNQRIQSLNVRGTNMSADNLAYFWLGLRQNSSVQEFLYQKERVAFAFDTLQAVEIELTFNQEINNTILPIVKSSFGRVLTSLKLSGVKILNMESVFKFLKLNETIDELDLSDAELNSKKIYLLAKGLVMKDFEISKLDLSKNQAIKDKDCTTLKNIFSRKSSVQYLFLDSTAVTEKGVEAVTQGIAENLKVHTISFRSCQVQIDDPTAREWKDIIQNLKQNCSLTLLDLDGNNKVCPEFLQEVDVDIQKNRLIVENIFPEIRKQEKEHNEKKEARKRRREFKRAKTQNDPRSLRRQKMKRSASFTDSIEQKKTIHRSKTTGGKLKKNSKGGDRETPYEHRGELSSVVADAVFDEVECQSVATKHNDLDDLLHDQEQDLKAEQSDGKSDQSDEGFDLNLGNMTANTKDFSFLTKFMTQFKKIKNVDMGKAKASKKDLDELAKVVQSNPYIQEMKMNEGGMSKKAKDLMHAELAKNKEIHRYGHTAMEGIDDDAKELDLHDQHVDTQALTKMIKFKQQLEDLDLSGNNIGNHGAKDVAIMIEENTSIKRLILNNCGIGTAGLQLLVSSLCKDPDETVELLDIQNNFIPDKHLKMLLVLIYKNRNIQDIRYSLTEEENKERKEHYLQLTDVEGVDPLVAQKKLGHGHHDHYRWWDYALVFPWLWKSFVHAKHEAFAFKYDPEVMRLLEENEMRPIRIMMYFWTVVYFIIIFASPFIFKQHYCGGLFYHDLYYVYGTYAILNAIWEVNAVLRIQAVIRRKTKNKRSAKKVLDFNRWHVVELFMGQIARFDTFLDFMFIVIVMECPELRVWLCLTSFYMIANFLYPTAMLIYKLRMPSQQLQHTMPYMEATNFLSFVRENMLLATVVDSFCINNTFSLLKKKHVTFGRLMGAHTFFLQDFPQFSIHAYFKIHPMLFAIPAVHYHLKAQTLLLVSMIVSGMAVCISCFNMIMCVENEFDPVLVEVALHQRRLETAEKEKEKLLQRQAEQRKQSQQNAMKNALMGSLMKSAGGEQKGLLNIGALEKETPKVEGKIVSKFMQMNKVHSLKKQATFKDEPAVELEMAQTNAGGVVSAAQATPRDVNAQPDAMATNRQDDSPKSFLPQLVEGDQGKKMAPNFSIQNEIIKDTDGK